MEKSFIYFFPFFHCLWNSCFMWNANLNEECNFMSGSLLIRPFNIYTLVQGEYNQNILGVPDVRLRNYLGSERRMRVMAILLCLEVAHIICCCWNFHKPNLVLNLNERVSLLLRCRGSKALLKKSPPVFRGIATCCTV